MMCFLRTSPLAILFILSAQTSQAQASIKSPTDPELMDGQDTDAAPADDVVDSDANGQAFYPLPAPPPRLNTAFPLAEDLLWYLELVKDGLDHKVGAAQHTNIVERKFKIGASLYFTSIVYAAIVGALIIPFFRPLFYNASVHKSMFSTSSAIQFVARCWTVFIVGRCLNKALNTVWHLAACKKDIPTNPTDRRTTCHLPAT